jgi:hypothetical protein
MPASVETFGEQEHVRRTAAETAVTASIRLSSSIQNHLATASSSMLQRSA